TSFFLVFKFQVIDYSYFSGGKHGAGRVSMESKNNLSKNCRQVGVSRYYLNSVALGKIKPGYHLCVRIEQFTEGKVTVRVLLGPFHDKKENQFSTCQKAD